MARPTFNVQIVGVSKRIFWKLAIKAYGDCVDKNFIFILLFDINRTDVKEYNQKIYIEISV